MKKLVVGPLLGLEGNNIYTFCFLSPSHTKRADIIVHGRTISADLVTQTPDGIFWRAAAEIDVPAGPSGSSITYTVHLDSQTTSDQNGRFEWAFYVPGAEEEPIITYASCNGVPKSDMLTKIERPFGLWSDMQKMHAQNPISLLLMGGDQLYADSIWDKVKGLEQWASLTQEEQTRRPLTKALSEKIDRFYSKLYTERWNEKYMSLMLASVPSTMMWDDHDIFDGWGSFPDIMQSMPVFKGIFTYAKKYFEIFQVRSLDNRSLILGTTSHYSLFYRFRNYNILSLDNRSERSIRKIMSEDHWQDLIPLLRKINTGHLLVMTAVPVVYRDFSFTETVFDITPWDEELTDDIKDHWRAKEHQGERNRFIMHLLDNAHFRARADNQNKTIILSGDVHIGCLGVITDNRQPYTIKIHQVVSSAIVHPPPSRIAWLGIRAVTNDNTETLNEDKTIQIDMLKPVGSNKYIRARNFVTLHRGTDDKIWINWITETDENPVYPIS